jgi:hypothetical protein
MNVKKILGLICTIALLIVSSISVYAGDNRIKADPNSTAAVNYQRSHHQSHSDKVIALQNEGLSKDDAEYYADVDDKVLELENKGIKYDLKNVTAIAKEQIAADPAGFKRRVLELDPSAIKAGLSSPIFSEGSEDVTKLMKDNPYQNEYTVQYPDGSYVSFKGIPAKKSLNKTTEQVIPQGYSEYVSWQHYSNGDGSYSGGSTEWKFATASSYSKTSVFNVSFTLSNNHSHLVSYQTGQASYGVVGISNAAQNSISDGYNISSYAQAQDQVVFNVSGSFGATYYVLSISENTGAYWTQYADFRIYGNGLQQGVAADYT